MGNIHKATLTMCIMIASVTACMCQTDVVNHFQKYRESEILASYKTDDVDVTALTEFNCRTRGEFYYDLMDEPVYQVEDYIRYAKIKKYGVDRWAAMVKKYYADDIGGNLVDIVFMNITGMIEHVAFDLYNQFDHTAGEFTDFTILNDELFAALSDKGQRIYFYNIVTKEIFTKDLQLSESQQSTIEYLPNQTYVIVNDSGIHTLDNNFNITASLTLNLSNGFDTDISEGSILHIISSNKKYIFNAITSQLIDEYDTGSNQTFVSIDAVNDQQHYVLSKQGDEQILEFYDLSGSPTLITIPERYDYYFDQVSANADEYQLYGTYNKHSLEQYFFNWPQQEDSLASIVYHNSTLTNLTNEMDFSLEIKDTYRTLDTIEIREDVPGEISVITLERFHFKYIITNHGTTKINDISLYSNGGRVFNCGRFYFKETLTDLNLAPNETYINDASTSVLHYNFQQFCLFANSANSILDLDMSNNEVCVNVLDAPLLDGLVDDDKEWYVGFSNSNMDYTVTRRYKFSETDVLFNEQVYRELLRSSDEFGENFVGTGVYYRDSGSRVYAYILEEDLEVLAYDFGLAVGDVFVSQAVFGRNEAVDGLIVTKVDTLSLEDGNIKKRLYLSCYAEGETQGNEIIWIEDIGDIMGVQMLYGRCEEEGDYSTLRCSYDDTLLTYTGEGNCWLVPTSEIAYQDLNIYPNPATERIEIITEETIKKISILNIQGQLLIESDKKVIGLNSLRQGLYMVKVENEYGAFSIQQFVKL